MASPLRFVLSLIVVALPPSTPPDSYRPSLTLSEGYAGASFAIEFLPLPAGLRAAGCSAQVGDGTVLDCAGAPRVDLRAPNDAKPGPLPVHWHLWNSDHFDVASGDVEFTVLEPRFTVTATPSVVVPGSPVTVEFTPRTDGVEIVDCGAIVGDSSARCNPSSGPERTILVPIPADSTATALTWDLSYRGPVDGGVGSTTGTIPLVIRGPPEFAVQPGTETAAPGVPFTVAFTSLTTGVTIKSCGLTYAGRRAACSRSGVAAVLGPSDAGTLHLVWDLTYASTRPGEEPGRRNGTLDAKVVVEQPRFAVTVQPASALPGDEVTLSFESLVKGIDIVDCIAFFPHAPDGLCQRTPQRWLARTRVPADAPPGATLLRWGIASTDSAGRPGTASDVIAYTVRQPEAPPTTKPPTSRPPLAIPPTKVTLPTKALEAPAFVAVTDPEAARPGDRVTVTVSALDPSVRITGCVVAFAGATDVPCRRGVATLRVPADAPPGDLPITWSVTSSGRSTDGTVPYRVLAPGEQLPPAFSVLPEPPAARAGGHVTITHRSLVDGVTITGCKAGFTPESMAGCHPSADGWAADVPVPPAVPPGNDTVLWSVSYTRAGQAAPASVDGLLTYRVLAEPVAASGSVWRTLWGIGIRVLLGGALLAGLIGSRGLLRRVRDRWRHGRPGADLPGGVRVVPVAAAGAMAVRVGDPDRPAPHLIRLTVHRPPPDVRIREESR